MFDTAAMKAAAGLVERESLTPVERLRELFPSYDVEILESVLESSGHDVEVAVAALLEMTSTTSGAPGPTLDGDEELAYELFRTFAAEVEEHVPADVRADPERYEAYARQQYDQFVQGQEQGGGEAAPNARVFKRLGGLKMSSLMRSMGRRKAEASTPLVGGSQQSS